MCVLSIILLWRQTESVTNRHPILHGVMTAVKRQRTKNNLRRAGKHFDTWDVYLYRGAHIRFLTHYLGNSRSWKLSTGQLLSWINPLENFLSSKIYAKKKLMVKIRSVMALNTISNFTIDHLFFLPFTVYCNFTFIISSVFVVKSCDFRDSKR